MSTENQKALKELISMLRSGAMFGGSFQQRAQFLSALTAAINPWISTEDRPLYTVDGNGNWEATKDGEQPFLAAVLPRRGEDWWIRQCVIEDGEGLCVVDDDGNTPAVWDLQAVEYWMPITNPEKS